MLLNSKQLLRDYHQAITETNADLLSIEPTETTSKQFETTFKTFHPKIASQICLCDGC